MAVPTTSGLFPTSEDRLNTHRIVAAQRFSKMLCIHPWEIDPFQPRLNPGMKTRIRHYTNLGKTYDRLTSLLQSGEFTTQVERFYVLG
jgi:hypothetical protein